MARWIRALVAAGAAVLARGAEAGASDTYVPYLHLDLANGGVQSDLSDLRPFADMRIGGTRVSVDALPPGLVNHRDLGLVTPSWIDDIQVIHRWPQPGPKTAPIRSWDGPKPYAYVDCPRLVITASGEYLLMVIAGNSFYGRVDPTDKVNDIFIYRSRDRGRTWSRPYLATSIAYNQHAWVPMLQSGSSRLVEFSTEPREGDFTCPENAGLGMRTSDDDGYTWSRVKRISPLNDPGFQAVWCQRDGQTARGTWLIVPQEGFDFRAHSVHSRMYVLRSVDHGATWTAIPGPRRRGWQWAPAGRMEEGIPLTIGNRVVILARTMEGHLWRSESDDDGLTWSRFAATPLVHPDAPPMVNLLSDGRTIIALTHNRKPSGALGDRSELWISESKDAGLTWTEPRFLASTSLCNPNSLLGTRACMSYSDIVDDHGQINIFIPHLWRQVLYLRLKESDIGRLPTRKELFPAE